MGQVVLRNEKEWNKWRSFSIDYYFLGASYEEDPGEYPCILVIQESYNEYNKKDTIIYDFVYQSSFD